MDQRATLSLENFTFSWMDKKVGLAQGFPVGVTLLQLLLRRPEA